MLDEKALQELIGVVKSYEKLKHSSSFKEWVKMNDEIAEIKALLKEFISIQTDVSYKTKSELDALKKMFEEAKP